MPSLLLGRALFFPAREGAHCTTDTKQKFWDYKRPCSTPSAALTPRTASALRKHLTLCFQNKPPSGQSRDEASLLPPKSLERRIYPLCFEIPTHTCFLLLSSALVSITPKVHAPDSCSCLSPLKHKHHRRWGFCLAHRCIPEHLSRRLADTPALVYVKCKLSYRVHFRPALG